MRALRTILLLLSAVTLGTACGDGGGGVDDTDILECTGECNCNEETNTCSCLGGSDCSVESAGEVTLVCEGNARCDLECGPDCTVECPGTAGCTALMGDMSTGVCNGTGDCDFTCDGDCAVDCPGFSRCTLDCAPDATCEITSCGMALEDCGDGLLVCRGSCPS